MDVLSKIVQGTGCAVDGTVLAQNPLSRALDNVVQSHARGSQKRGSIPPHGARSELHKQMQMQRPDMAQGGSSRFLTAFELEAANRSSLEAAYRSGKVQLMHTHQASMEAAFEEALRAQVKPEQMPVPSLLIMDPNMIHPSASQWIDDFHLSNEAWRIAGKSHHEVARENSNGQVPIVHQPMMHSLPASTNQMTQAVDDHLKVQQASSEMARTMSQSQNLKWQNSQFLKFMNQISSGEVQIDEEKNKVVELKMEGALEGAWENTSNVPSNRNVLNASSQLSDNTSATDLEIAFADAATAHKHPLEMDKTWTRVGTADSKGLEKAWNDSNTANEEAMYNAWADDDLVRIWDKTMATTRSADPFEDAWDEATGHNYYYKSDNPFLDSTDNFQRGIDFFKSGHLDNAILAFEAEVQLHSDNSEAWRMLGECHAENDEDKSAIACLERSIEEDPYNLSALLALGVSNVNESNLQGALKTLKGWVQHNPKFHRLEIQVDEYSDGSLMDEVMQLMLQARAHDPNDSDVQVVLGVLYNVSKDYDAAVESFKAATELRPDEYALWNKTGATLANSARSSEAIPAYHRALELKPRYARGWLNLGISHANLGNYEEATKCYLQALSLNSRADHIWSYLRICFTCMERFDLVKMADTRDINNFRAEFKVIDL